MTIDDTPLKATFTTKNYGLPGENTKVQSGQHIEHNLLLTRTTNPRPLQENSHIQTQESLDNTSEQSMVVDMTNTTLQPEPGYPDYSIYLPMPCESESEQESPSTPSTMNIDWLISYLSIITTPN